MAEQVKERDGSERDAPSIDPRHEAELGALLEQLGVDTKPSLVLAYLAAAGHGRSSEIEDACDLRQPEVSQATKALREKGWVVAKPEKTPGKGRPVNVYSLRVSLADVVNELEARKREQINKELARIDRLRQITDVDPAVEDLPEASTTELPS